MTIRLSHEDSYMFTAIAVAACVIQYLDGTHEPGLHFQSHFLNPRSLLQVLTKLGLLIVAGLPDALRLRHTA